MAAVTLTEAEIVGRLAKLSEWKRHGKSISRTFDRGDFNGSMTFVIALAHAANEADHHPDILISWNHVKITLSSHDVNALTDRDFSLAATIDTL